MNAIISIIYQALQNLDYLSLLFLVFVSVSLASGGVCVFFLNNRNAKDRLKRLLSTGPDSATTPEKPKIIEEDGNEFLAKLTKPLHSITGTEKNTPTKKLKTRLVQAGFRSQRAYTKYLAIKIFFTLGLVLISMFATMALYKLSSQTLLITAVLAVIGFLLPDMCLDYLVHRRKRNLTRALPDALDLMVLCVEAGLGLDMTIKKVGDEMASISLALSEEFNLTNLEIRAGRARDESFKNMSTRTGVPEISNLMTVLSQTSRFGTSIAKALRIHSDGMRIKRRQDAEERAAKSAVKLMLPLVLFIFPVIFVVLVGPAAIQIIDSIFASVGG